MRSGRPAVTRSALGLCLAAAAAGLVACGGAPAQLSAPPPAVAGDPASSPAPPPDMPPDTPAAPAPTSSAAPPTAGPMDNDPTVTGSPSWDNTAANQAAAAARDTVATWVRKDLSPVTWWQRLAPMMSTRAAYDYAGDKPTARTLANLQANVPGTRLVAGNMQVGPGPSPALAVVTVPTDAGTVTVLLSRTPIPDQVPNPWLVEHLVPAQR